MLTELEKSPSHRNDQAYMHTLAYVVLGDRDRAFALMERLYETHNIDLLALKTIRRWMNFVGMRGFKVCCVASDSHDRQASVSSSHHVPQFDEMPSLLIA